MDQTHIDDGGSDYIDDDDNSHVDDDRCYACVRVCVCGGVRVTSVLMMITIWIGLY